MWNIQNSAMCVVVESLSTTASMEFSSTLSSDHWQLQSHCKSKSRAGGYTIKGFSGARWIGFANSKTPGGITLGPLCFCAEQGFKLFTKPTQ